MRINKVSAMVMLAGVTAACLIMAAPAFPQTSAVQKQKTQDGGGPAVVGPASGASKQKTQDGGSPAAVGPASGASKQKTQSLSHSEPTSGAKQN